jgi:hypothetical protein
MIAGHRGRVRGLLEHGAVGTALTILSIIWSIPLVFRLSTHLPGAGLGDNTMFLWNFWWMRTALATGHDFFRTDYLFAPVGVDLTLHTSTALPALVGATLLGRLPVLTALNIMTLSGLALNAICTYALAWRLTRDRGAALLAGIVFGASPYIAAHFNGHFNLTQAWTIPLFALTLQDALRGSMRWAVLCGFVLGVTAYIDYYYVVYEIAFAICAFALVVGEWSWIRASKPPPGWCFALVSGAIASDCLLIAFIGLTGGTTISVGAVTVGLHDTYNPRQFLWMLVALALWMHFRPRLRVRRRQAALGTRPVRTLAIVGTTFVITAAPVVWHGIGLFLRQEYVTQRYFWRSAPAGIDIATLFLGNPFHGLWGSSVRHVYGWLGIDVIEWGAWLGIVPLILAASAIRRQGTDSIVRLWLTAGAVFLIWALGPHVRAFGGDTGLMMPGILLRYVPIAANARIPGRAMVMVYLAVAMLTAIAAAEYRRRTARPVLWLFVIATVAFGESIPAPFPLVSATCPSIYMTLRERPERGAIAELPLGIRDGFGEISPVDDRMLVCQTIHARPVVGGVVARLPPTVIPAYMSDPLLAVWLRLSGARLKSDPGALQADRDVATERLAAAHIAFIMLNRRTASSELQAYVEKVLPVTRIADDDERSLYVVSSGGNTLTAGAREQMQ